MTSRKKTAERCASCRAKKGRMHGLHCQIENRTLFPDGPVYNVVTVDIGSSSPGSSCDSSSSDSGSAC